jgi:HEXXH motif-containing protein
MSARYHRLPRNLFDALAAGGGGPDAIRQLAAARRSKLGILLWGVRSTAWRAGAEQARLARQGYDLLADVENNDPAVHHAAIQHPSVGAWALRTVQALDSDPADAAAEPGRLSALAAAAAIRAGLPAEIEVTAADGTVMLPSLGAASVDGGIAVVHSHRGQAEVSSAGRRVEIPADPHQDAPGWFGLRRLGLGPLQVLIDDLDPYRMPSARDNLAPRLTAAETDRLAAALRQAWPLLEAYHPVIAAELAAAITVIVPLTNQHGQASLSSPATFGAIAMSVPPDPYTGAETLAHEIQHLKLSALLEITPLTLPDNGRLYYAPWRPDPRPIGGLIQGAYAFLGVSGFWRRQRQVAQGALRLRAETQFARWRTAAAGVVRSLRSSGQLTPAGVAFVRGMAQTLDVWLDEPVGADALALARREAEQHLTRWQLINGPLPAV